MIGYKLLKKRKDGSIGPLFINASARLPTGEWLEAEAHHKKGFAFRPGWHVLAKPLAPHLKLNLSSGERREFWLVEIKEFATFLRPDSQGGMWFLANKMKLIRKL